MTANNLAPIIARHAHTDSKFNTDEANIYVQPGRWFVDHQTVNHAAREYVRDEAYTNTIEGYFSILKRGIYGVYQHVSEAHLHRYLAEFDFRYLTGSRPDLTIWRGSTRRWRGSSAKG